MIRYAMASLLLTGTVALAQESARVPLGGGADGVDGLRLVALANVTASLESAERADGERAALKATFTKEGPERRLLALEAVAKGDPTGCKALAIRYRLQLTQGEAPRLTLVLYERGGGAWFKVGAQPLAAGGFSDMRLALSSLKQAEFSEDPDGELHWDQIEKVWLGLAIDGPAAGTFELSQAFLTNEPYRPTQPLRIAVGDPKAWHVGKDPAAEGTVTIQQETPGGASYMKFDFSFPGGRHMYDIPSLTLPEVELDGYRAFQFTYKATIPKGINGLLVMLQERDGSQYCADPPPPASGDWRTATIPIEAFKRGSWSKDENDRMDRDQIAHISIGVHGATSDGRGVGWIMAKDIQFVP